MVDTTKISPELKAASEMLAQGQLMEAQASYKQHVEKVIKEFGKDSPEYAHCQYEFSTIYFFLNDPQAAEKALQTAIDTVKGNDQLVKERLAYYSNLATALEQQNRLEDADKLLHTALEERLKFYEDGHPGRGYGYKALAQSKYLQGQLKEAAEMADKALEIFWSNQHFEVSSVIPLRSLILKTALGPEIDTLEALSQLSDELIERTFSQLDYFITLAPPEVGVHMLLEFEKYVSDSLKDSPLHVTLLGALTTFARKAGLQDIRVEGFKRLLELCKRVKSLPVADVIQGLALAYVDGKDFENADKCYQESFEIAEANKDWPALSNALRNASMFELNDRKDSDKALKYLNRAVDCVREYKDNPLMLGRALAARGLYFQHAKQQEAAKKDLQEALTHLPPEHPDCITTRSHLGALERGSEDCCGDPYQALSESLRAMVLPHMPDDLIKELGIRMGANGKPSLEIVLAREPKDGEVEKLQSLLADAQRTIHTKSQKQGMNEDGH